MNRNKLNVRMDRERLFDEAFSQYIKDAIASANELVIKHLPLEDQRIIHHIEDASLEQRLHLLAKLGKRYAVVVFDRQKAAEKPFNTKSAIRWIQKRSIELIGPALKSWGLFIRADKELMQNLSRLSMDITPETMYIIRNYKELTENIDAVSDILAKSNAEAIVERKIDNLICKTFELYWQFSVADIRRWKIKSEHIPILFHCSANRNRYIAGPEFKALYSYLTPRTLELRLKELVENGLLQEEVCNPGDRRRPGRAPKNLFQLTGLGVHLCHQLRDRIVSKLY